MDVFDDIRLEKIEHKGDKTIITHGQETYGIQERNYLLRKNTKDSWRRGMKVDMVHYASIPLVMWLQWESLGITKDENLLKKMIELHADEVKVTKKKC